MIKVELTPTQYNLVYAALSDRWCNIAHVGQYLNALIGPITREQYVLEQLLDEHSPVDDVPAHAWSASA